MPRRRGPIHCLSSSGSVYARNSSSRGASNSRIILTCGMPGSAISCVSPMMGSFRIVLQGGQQLVEPLEALGPVLAVARQPLRGGAQRLCLEVAQPHGGLAAAGDEPGLLEHLEVP